MSPGLAKRVTASEDKNCSVMVLLLSSSKCYIVKKVLAPLKFYNAE